jgi:serine/threonine protein kinase
MEVNLHRSSSDHPYASRNIFSSSVFRVLFVLSYILTMLSLLSLFSENVLVSNEGYPIIVDFGFAKYVSDKTYTLCGTPLYLPPEVILNRGHNWGADHWSLGVLSYEMFAGQTPFYVEGMDQMDLFRAIVKCKYDLPKGISSQAASLLTGFITKDPAKRLGSLAGGEDDIPVHPFFDGLDFDLLRQMEIKAPYVPKIKDPLDSSNFENWSHLDDKLDTKFPPLTPEQMKVFEAF